LSNDTRAERNGDRAGEQDVIIGRVKSVNVPKRQLRIVPETSYPERFNQLRQLSLKTKEGRRIRLALEDVKVGQSVVVARVGVENEDEIASTRGAFVVVPRSERYELPEDEYYIDDLVGLVVKDSSGSIIGRLSEVWETPANDIYQVLDAEGREILLPAIEDVILKVDIEGGEMIADISNLI